MHAGVVDCFLQQIEQRQGKHLQQNEVRIFFSKLQGFRICLFSTKNEVNVVCGVPVVLWTYLWLHSALT